MNDRAKHTPGPWIVRTGAVYSETRIRSDGLTAVRVALMDREEPGTRPTERDANARLIAAAPDLLEAVTELLGPLATIPMGEGGTPTEQVPEKANLRVSEAALRRARAAIARAQGSDG